MPTHASGGGSSAGSEGGRVRISTRVPPGAPGTINVVCKFFQSGYCARGSECRFLHLVREASTPSGRQNAAASPSLSFARPSASDYVVRDGTVNARKGPAHWSRAPQGGYVDFATAYAACAEGPEEDDDEDEDERLLREAAPPTHGGGGFVTTVDEIRAGSYAAVAGSRRGMEVEDRGAARRAYDKDLEGAFGGLRVDSGFKDIVCKYHAEGGCRYGAYCRFTHGEPCEHCGKNAIHPTDESEAARHREACIAERGRRERLEECADVECGICYESPVRKSCKFGLLQNCEHAFCLTCIREWRGSESVETFGREAVRVCPVCRTESYLVIPSDTYVRDEEVRAKMLGRYKEKLGSIPCKHFEFGEKECPFGSSCLYAHVDKMGNRIGSDEAPPLIVSDTGVRVKTTPSLADYLPG